jgi:3-oxoadipate enol-lactonase
VALLDIDGTRIAYDEHGRGAGLVFMHDCGLSRLMWEPLADALRGSFRVVAPDMRGHGSSDIPSFVATVRRMSDDVKALVSALELGPVVLVGQSMGANIALDYALRHGGEVRGLVLIGPGTRPDSRVDEDDRYRALQALRAEGAAGFARVILSRLFPGDGSASSHELVASVRRILETTSAAGIASALAAMASRPDARASLEAIAVPTLFVAGADDDASVEESHAAASLVPDGRVSVVDGAGALPSLENPTAFTAALKEFVATLPEIASTTATVAEKALAGLPKLLPGLLRA